MKYLIICAALLLSGCGSRIASFEIQVAAKACGDINNISYIQSYPRLPSIARCNNGDLWKLDE